MLKKFSVDTLFTSMGALLSGADPLVAGGLKLLESTSLLLARELDSGIDAQLQQAIHRHQGAFSGAFCSRYNLDESQYAALVNTTRECFAQAAIGNAEILLDKFDPVSLSQRLDWDSVNWSLDMKEACQVFAFWVLRVFCASPNIYLDLLPQIVKINFDRIRSLEGEVAQVKALLREMGEIDRRLESDGDYRFQQYLSDMANRGSRNPLPDQEMGAGALQRYYVPLRATVHPDPTPLEKSDREEQIRGMRKDHSDGRERDSKIDDFLATGQGNRLLLLGDPGSGKSTYLNHLLWRMANGSSDVPDALCALIPLKLRLTDLYASLKEQPRDRRTFWDVLYRCVLRDIQHDTEASAEDRNSASLIRDRFRGHGNRLLVLMDGLDEVSDTGADIRDEIAKRKDEIAGRKDRKTARAQLLDWLNREMSDPGIAECRWMMTARTYIYDRALGLDGFDILSLQPFDDGERKLYVERFAAARLPDAKRARYLATVQDYLGKRVSEAFSRMIGRPLLLAIACELFEDAESSSQPVPADRPGLYERMLKMILKRWPARRPGPASGFFASLVSDEHYPYFVAALQQLAFNTLKGAAADRNQAPEISRLAVSALLTKLEDWVKDESERTFTGSELLEYLEKQTGLLFALDADHFTFVHLNLQEYLAARHVLQPPDSGGEPFAPDQAVDMVELLRGEPERWREVYLLTVGECARRGDHFRARGLIEQLLPKDTKRPTDEWKMGELASLAYDEFAPALGEEEWRALDLTKPIINSAAFELVVESPATRAIAGRILGRIGDTRQGVGLDDSGLPDIDWVDIKEPNIAYRLDSKAGGYDGQYRQLVGDAKGPLKLNYAYQIARFPVTWSQYQCFVTDPRGYHNDEWWEGMSFEADERQLSGAHWPVPNHPRETVNWCQCVAFCRWLTQRKSADGSLADGLCISLPNEWEWQFAATGGDSTVFLYPWGPEYQAGYANINETRGKAGAHNLGRTTAVGLYPQGATSHDKAPGMMDMSGNVWEWCLNQSDSEGDMTLSGRLVRAVRGGSWSYMAENVSGAIREIEKQPYRDNDGGFRVVCVPSNRRNSEN